MWRTVYEYIMLVLSVAIILGCVAHLALLRLIDGPIRLALTILFVAIGSTYVLFFLHGIFGEGLGVSDSTLRLIFRFGIFAGVSGCYYIFWKVAKDTSPTP